MAPEESAALESFDDSAADESMEDALESSGLGEDAEPKSPRPQKKADSPKPAPEPKPEPEAEPEPAAGEDEDGAEGHPAEKSAEQLNREVKGLEKVKIHQQTIIDRQERLLERLAGEIQQIRERLEPETEKEEEPTFSEDPETGVRRIIQEELAPVKELAARDQEREEEREIQTVSADVRSHHETTKEAFVAEHPDYPTAAKWLANQELAELKAEISALGPENNGRPLTEEEIAGLALVEHNKRISQQVIFAASNRKNLHDIAYRRAVARGWSPQLAEADETSESEVTDPKLRNVAESVRRTKAPRPASATPRAKLTKQSYKRASDDQFDEMMESYSLEDLLGVAAEGHVPT